MSHVPALLLLDFNGQSGRSAFVVFFLVMVVQTGGLMQYLAERSASVSDNGYQRQPVAPRVSKSFHWRSWLTGLVAAGLVGLLLSSLTPFVPGQALALALLASAAGSLGHLVMKALKRDRGITNWGGEGRSVTGAGGLLDRVDALCFAAPVFFHSVRWKFGL
jgi:phosphatidate cytidylyltransferase